MVDAFEPLLLCQLLSDQACWKYACQKQEIRDFEILQSEALVRSLHSSHILNSKPSKSKCQITTCQMTTSICRTQPRASDPKWAKSLTDSETSKVLLIVCLCLQNSRKSTSVFPKVSDLPKTFDLTKEMWQQCKHIHTVQTILRCHGGD